MLGLRPGLLAKYQAATTESAKWAFLKAFLLDPQSLSSLTVESFYVDQSIHDDSANWVERPLHLIRKEFPESFIKSKILDVQTGRNHPQDPNGENPEMKIYWVFKETKDKNTNRKAIGHALRATSEVPHNKAALTAISDGMPNFESTFGKGKGHGHGSVDHGGKGPAKGVTKPKPAKQPKATINIFEFDIKPFLLTRSFSTMLAQPHVQLLHL